MAANGTVCVRRDGTLKKHQRRTKVYEASMLTHSPTGQVGTVMKDMMGKNIINATKITRSRCTRFVRTLTSSKQQRATYIHLREL